MSDFQVCNKCGGRIIFRKIDGVATPIHLTGSCFGVSGSKKSISSDEYAKRYKNKRLNRVKKLIRSFTIPNTSCPVCGAKVFYYENEHGSKVFFDKLGPPWPKHPCTDKSKKSINLSEKIKRTSNWKRFYPEHIESNKIKGGAWITSFYGFYLMGKSDKEIYFELFALSRKPVKQDITPELCYWSEKSRGIYVLSSIKKNRTNKALYIEAFSKSEFRTLFSEFSPKKKMNTKGRLHLNSNRKGTKHKQSDRFVNEIIGLTPVLNPLSCPFCKTTVAGKEALKEHLSIHWPIKSDKTIFSKMTEKEWINFIIKTTDSDQK
jgi:DNA-directed RNA polymerase subunit RPC12/RpoP